jgi:DNA polymerase III alpha subunit
MITDAYGSVKYSVKETLDEMYSGNAVDQFVVDDEKENKLHSAYNRHFEIQDLQKPPTLDVSPEDFHDILSNSWLMPQKYKDMDLNAYLAQQLVNHNMATDPYTIRLVEELDEYAKRGMQDILKFLVYLMNICRDNSIVTGIGRGSSVSSLVLYLIGVHYIDPVKYNLSYKEFLR